MTKISTTTFKSHQTQEEAEETHAKEIQQNFADVLDKLGDTKLEAPQKSVNFILNFSKAYKAIPLRDGSKVGMLIN